MNREDRRAQGVLNAFLMSFLSALRRFATLCWQGLREASGDDAYERYLAHWHACHAYKDDHPMDRKTFFKAEQERKWNGVRRCC